MQIFVLRDDPCLTAYQLWKDKKVRFYIGATDRDNNAFYGIRYSKSLSKEEGWFYWAEIELLNKYEKHKIQKQVNFRAIRFIHCT